MALFNAEDLLSLQSLTDAQLSPDGELIAFAVTDTFKDKTRFVKSAIWVVPAAGGEARPFTGGSRSDTTPRWSPDGRRLAFLSDRLEDGRHQLYVIPRDGGEARALTDVKGSINWLGWSPDGRQIAIILEDAETEDERKRKEAKDDPLEFELHHKFARVWVLDVATRELRCVTTADVQVWEAAWSPDGRDFALLVSTEPYEWSWYEAYLARVPAAGGEIASLLNPVPRQLSMPRWSPDSRQIAYLACAWSDRGAVGGDLYVTSADGGSATNLTVDYRGSVRSLHWSADGGALLALATEDARSALLRITLDGVRHTVWSGPVGLSERFQPTFSSALDGARLAVIREDFDHPREVWAGERTGDGAYAWRQLTHFNPQVKDWTLGLAEELRWTSADGLALQGFVIKPVGYESGKRYPAITIVHGGPAALHDFRFSATIMAGWAQLFATRGYLVFLPNPRGSFGWGTAFTESNLGDMGGKDMQDVLAGIDHLIAQGLVDAGRLGIAGWSYGGFMTCWMVTQTPRFQVAIMGAGISNWLSFHGVSTLSTWDQQFYLADPYERDGTYTRFSPMTYVHQVRTPTLILHGEKDPVVPVGQAYEFFRALKELKTPVELVVYPREGHGVMEKAHRLHLSNRVLDWIARYLPA
jgi:dipeptidyl aminopeptidase/acylaminoacyl peptidase